MQHPLERLAEIDRELDALASSTASDPARVAVDALPRAGLDAVARERLAQADALLDSLYQGQPPSRPEPSRAEPSRPEPSRAEPPRRALSLPEPSRGLPARKEPPREEPTPQEAPRVEAVSGSATAVHATTREPASVESVVPTGMHARPASWTPPPPAPDAPTDGSGLMELPEEELRRSDLPPVLSLAPPAPIATSSVAELEPRPAVPPGPPDETRSEVVAVTSDLSAPASSVDEPLRVSSPALELELADLGTVSGESAPLTADDITAQRAVAAPRAMDFDQLFGVTPPPPPPDLEPAAPTSNSDDGFADLFRDDAGSSPPAARSDAPRARGGGATDTSEGDAPENTALFSAEEMLAIRSSLPPPRMSELDLQVDEVVSDRISETVEPSEPLPSGEFELLVDEDVLVLDDTGAVDELPPAKPPKSQLPPPPPKSQLPPPTPKSRPPSERPDGSGGGKGFFSRILNRKP